MNFKKENLPQNKRYQNRKRSTQKRRGLLNCEKNVCTQATRHQRQKIRRRYFRDKMNRTGENSSLCILKEKRKRKKRQIMVRSHDKYQFLYNSTSTILSRCQCSQCSSEQLSKFSVISLLKLHIPRDDVVSNRIV